MNYQQYVLIFCPVSYFSWQLLSQICLLSCSSDRSIPIKIAAGDTHVTFSILNFSRAAQEEQQFLNNLSRFRRTFSIRLDKSTFFWTYVILQHKNHQSTLTLALLTHSPTFRLVFPKTLKHRCFLSSRNDSSLIWLILLKTYLDVHSSAHVHDGLENGCAQCPNVILSRLPSLACHMQTLGFQKLCLHRQENYVHAFTSKRYVGDVNRTTLILLSMHMSRLTICMPNI